MVQIPILNGIYADTGPDLRTSYPVNMVPVPKGNGISNGFSRPADGIVGNGTGPTTRAPVRSAVSTMRCADESSTRWSYAFSRIRIFCFAMFSPADLVLPCYVRQPVTVTG